MKQTHNQQPNEAHEQNRPNLAAFYAATVLDYFCGATPPEQMREAAEMMGDVLHEFGRIAAGTLPALMRITAHYAATSHDFDKAEAIATLTAANGAMAILTRITAEADRLNVWGDVFETIAEE